MYDMKSISRTIGSLFATSLQIQQHFVSAPLVGSAVRLVSSKEREREGEEEARRQVEEEERKRQEEEKKLEEEDGDDKDVKKRNAEEEEENEEEGRSLGSESYTTAASSLSYNVCKICHCGGEVVIILTIIIYHDHN